MKIEKAALGIDPGKTGALAILRLEDAEPLHVETCPPDIPQMAKLVQEMRLAFDIKAGAIEQVQPMPTQGVTSMFNFGMGFGAWQGMLSYAGIPYFLITPQRWQKRMFDSGSREAKDAKARSRNTVERLYPRLDLGRNKEKALGFCDAILIARYALTTAPVKRTRVKAK